MKPKANCVKVSWIIVLVLTLFTAPAEQMPVEFEPGKISTAAIEYGITFASDGQSLYFVRASGQWGNVLV